MLKCNQVTKIVATDDYRELGVLKKMEFKMHLLMCKHCQRYFSQLKSLGFEARRNAENHEAGTEQLQRMEKNIREQLDG
ncbi:MAG: hypothetical protein GY780_18475 [bacterium]|nr:hypothetical protein [bacterium]